MALTQIGSALDRAFRKDWEAAHEAGWSAFHHVYGLGAWGPCTIRNDGALTISLPIGKREAYLDLAPGEEASIRAVDHWWDI